MGTFKYPDWAVISEVVYYSLAMIGKGARLSKFDISNISVQDGMLSYGWIWDIPLILNEDDGEIVIANMV